MPINGLRHIRVKGEEIPWLERHLILAEHFDKSLMTKLWIRNRTNGGPEQEAGGDFYIQDGNHRALVYAVRVECGEENYDDVEALHKQTSIGLHLLKESILEVLYIT